MASYFNGAAARDSTTQTVSPLRQRMLDDMRMRKMAEHTQDGDVRAVGDDVQDGVDDIEDDIDPNDRKNETDQNNDGTTDQNRDNTNKNDTKNAK